MPVSEAIGNTTKSGPIFVRLTNADALTVSADLAFVGSGRKLLHRIESESGNSFARLEYPDWLQRKSGGTLDGIKTAQFLSAPNYVWKNVVAVNARPTSRPRARFQIEVQEAIVVSVRHVVRPTRVVFVPYHERPAEIVAMNTLCIIYFMMRFGFGKRKFHRSTEIVIADTDGTAKFREVLNGEIRKHQFLVFAKQQAEKFWFLSEEDIDENPPHFFFQLHD